MSFSTKLFVRYFTTYTVHFIKLSRDFFLLVVEYEIFWNCQFNSGEVDIKVDSSLDGIGVKMISNVSELSCLYSSRWLMVNDNIEQKLPVTCFLNLRKTTFVNNRSITL